MCKRQILVMMKMSYGQKWVLVEPSNDELSIIVFTGTR